MFRTYHINPSCLTPKSNKLLTRYLLQHPNEVILTPNHTYTTHNKSNQSIDLDVAQTILRRKRDHKSDAFEVIGKLIGGGFEGKVYLIDKTMTTEDKTMSLESKPQLTDKTKSKKRRVVKITDCTSSIKEEMVISSWNAARNIPILRTKKPIISIENNTTTAYTVMGLIEGDELFQVIHDDLYKKNVLTITQRITISIALLKALKIIHDNHIIHCDIKLENIIISKNYSDAAIIDYGMAQRIENYHHIVRGTLGYMAPEVNAKAKILDKTTHPYKIDVYALAIVLGYVWRGLIQHCYGFKSVAINFSTLFCGISSPDLNDDLRKTISSTLRAMSKINPVERLSLNEALEIFQKIQQDLQSFISSEKKIETEHLSIIKEDITSVTKPKTIDQTSVLDKNTNTSHFFSPISLDSSCIHQPEIISIKNTKKI